MKNMRTIVFVLAMGLILQPGFAQTVDVKVDHKIQVDVKSIAEEAVARVFDDFHYHDDDDDHRGTQYQQDSQEVEIPLSNPGERGSLKVESRNGRVKITTYDGASVKVKMTKYSKKVSNSQTKNGMRLVSSGGFNFEASENRNQVKIENEGWGSRVDFDIQVPKNFDLKVETYNNGHIEIDGVNGELDIESYNGPITLTNIEGSASASTYNGAVKVSFNNVTPDVPMTFNTYNGDVDITVPAGTKFSAKMKTNRDIFTDFESFSLSAPKPVRSNNDRRRGTSIKFENWVQGDLNGGGAEVTMKTRNGNVYIRKG